MEYQLPPSTGPLLQGELLLGAWEYRLLTPIASPDQIGNPGYHAFHHPILVILSPPCDLESDYRSRFVNPPANESALKPEELDSIPTRMAYVRVCDVYEEPTFRDALDPASDKKRFTTRIWERIRDNQDVRYHRLPGGAVGEEEIPPLFVDFKRTFGLPTESLWRSIELGHIKRYAVVPPIYVHDLSQRFSAFDSRIGQPLTD